jgi:dTDP-4-dehydrorhamnose 3,5-epimerase
MKFTPTEIADVFVVELEKREDDRGFFARGFCQREFEEHGMVSQVVQANISYNKYKGTLRGMHYQVSPYEETKFLRCTKGAVYDVIIDMRPESLSYMKWFGVELTDKNYKMLYVPRNFAHGFQTLEDETEVMYLVSEFYAPQSERGVRFDDPAFNIQWPLKVAQISEKDAAWPNYQVANPVGK